MKVLQYQDLPSQGIKGYEEVVVESDDFFPEGVHFRTPDRPTFVRHVWARNLHPKLEVLVVAELESPPDAHKRGEIAAGAIAFLLNQSPPAKTFLLSKQEIENLHQSN